MKAPSIDSTSTLEKYKNIHMMREENQQAVTVADIYVIIVSNVVFYVLFIGVTTIDCIRLQPPPPAPSSTSSDV